MSIKKVNISNYKCFESFSIEFNKCVNILVGNNEAGKSTILEAIHLALTGSLNGKPLRTELSQYLFNQNAVDRYLSGIEAKTNPPLPQIVIEIFFEDEKYPIFEGSGNSERIKAWGISLKIDFDDEYKAEYETLIQNPKNLTSLPIEYYKIELKSFARELKTNRSIPIKSVLIDSTSKRHQNGSDIYLSRIIRNDLEDSEKVSLSQAYRKMREAFMADPAIGEINKKLTEKSKVSEKELRISVDLSTQNSWENALMTYLDGIPFHQIGKGEQCIIKTNLALGHKKTEEANIILIEEPENHLSHTKLNELTKNITSHCITAQKQVIISTHSSFVANKLGLENLILLNDQKTTRLTNLSKDTFTFFKKLSGYQTLRLLLCRKAVLVEGDSDELIFQRAYLDKNKRLPIEDGIDVISVRLTFKRFLEIAQQLNLKVAVLTDNDGDYEQNIINKYKEFSDIEGIKICADPRNNLKTLEPQFVDANETEKLRNVLGLGDSYNTDEILIHHMSNKNNKTAWALKVFEADGKLNYPQYINDAVDWCNE